MTRGGLALVGAVALPSLLQFAVPTLLDVGRRDVSAVAAGQWWRLLTANFLQDGGWPGTVFNLVTLTVSVALVARILSDAAIAAVFVVGGFTCNALTAALLHQSGAGNSMATMCLVVLAAVVARRRAEADVVPLAALILVAVVLLVLRDQHGMAVTLGLLAGVARSSGHRVRPSR